MSKVCKRKFTPLLVCLCIGGALLIAGCKKKSTAEAAPEVGLGVAGKPESGPVAAGKKIFDSNGCGRCHSLGGGGQAAEGGRPGGRMKGPDLAHVGADPVHTRQWIADHIRNPKKHKPQSSMPPFAGKIKEDDLLTLADYLAGLK